MIVPSTTPEKQELQATPCGVTLIASMSFASKLAFYIRKFGYKKFKVLTITKNWA